MVKRTIFSHDPKMGLTFSADLMLREHETVHET